MGGKALSEEGNEPQHESDATEVALATSNGFVGSLVINIKLSVVWGVLGGSFEWLRV